MLPFFSESLGILLVDCLDDGGEELLLSGVEEGRVVVDIALQSLGGPDGIVVREMQKDRLEVQVFGAGRGELVGQVLLGHGVQDLDGGRVVHLGEVDRQVHDLEHAVVVVGDVVLLRLVVVGGLHEVLGGQRELLVVLVQLRDFLVGLGRVGHLVVLDVALDGLLDVLDAF